MDLGSRNGKTKQRLDYFGIKGEKSFCLGREKKEEKRERNVGWKERQEQSYREGGRGEIPNANNNKK